jgi:hypothetical protein
MQLRLGNILAPNASEKTTLDVKRRSLSFQSQVVPPKLLALNATNSAIGNRFPCRAILGHMNRKPTPQVPENASFFDCLASRPEPNLLKAISRQI